MNDLLTTPNTSTDLQSTPEVGAFLAALRPNTDLPLAFEYAGRRVRPGYHITEIKAARFDALDCGGNPETWTEALLQLWDVDGEPGRAMMTAGKFLSIYEKAAARLPLMNTDPVVFECGDRVSAAGRYTPVSVRVEGDVVAVALEPLSASCKPQDRWQEAERARASSVVPCCG